MEQDAIKQEIEKFVDKMGFGAQLDSVEAHQGTASRFSLRFNGDASMLIGEHGANLIAIEHLLKKIIYRKHGQEIKFTLDINDYRLKRLEDLKQEVKSAAKEVRTRREQVMLKPMSAFERRIVHLLLAEYPDIATESIGLEPERRVIIKPYP